MPEKKARKRRFGRPSAMRALVMFLLTVVQFSLIAYSIWTTSRLSVYLNAALSFVSLLVVLYIVSRRGDPAYNLIWSILILLVPVFGGLLYLFFGLQPAIRRKQRLIAALDEEARGFLAQDPLAMDALAASGSAFVREAAYLSSSAGFPVYPSPRSSYLASGEEKFELLKAELRSAERFIFLEYFIVAEGLMWNELLGILAEKARAGVEVRVMYDGIGCLLTLAKDYPRRLESLGIRCAVFGPARASLSSLQNNRDHRKIVVVDGRVAFTGGVNLADEYINAVDKYGHWKDAAVAVYGPAVGSLTVMFQTMWSLETGSREDYAKYAPAASAAPAGGEAPADGFVQPYADSPMDDRSVGEAVYLNVINGARRYVYITTPYLILDRPLSLALRLAAESGVDVRVITPRRWDKKLVHMATRAHYDELLAAGVRVYEYVDGFEHAKTFVADDELAVVGSTNLDYRSLYLHYECGAVLYGRSAARAVRADFERTLERCEAVAPGQFRPRGLPGRLLGQVLQLLAPIL